tara:strand:- start:106 stop:627 length:522 start_codon:yes stop_codon:yes gene_type:complete
MTESTRVGKGKITLTNNEVFHILKSQEWKCDKCEKDFKINIQGPPPVKGHREISLSARFKNDSEWFWSQDEYFYVNSENLNPRRKPKNRQSTTSKDLTSNAKKVENYLLLCARCDAISVKNDQINLRISSYQKKELQKIAKNENMSLGEYIYELLDEKLSNDENRSNWLNLDE